MNRKLLIVEDNPRMRQMIRAVVADLAAPITECEGGEEVCACYAARRPDWVLMDVELPGLDGIAATRALLAAEPATRVLIVTGYDDADFRCDTCSANVRMITPEETAALAQVAVRTIYRWVEA